MKLFVALIVPAYLLVAVNAVGIELGTVLEQQHGSMRMLLDAYGNPMARGGPSRAIVDQCFGNYMTDETAVVGTYNKAFIACSNITESAKKLLQGEQVKHREDLLVRGDAICSQMDACKDPTDVMEFFHCYHEAANNNSEALFGISMDSDTYATNLQTKYDQLENDYKVCVSVAHNKYLGDIFSTNKKLQLCLAGRSNEGPANEPHVEAPTPIVSEPIVQQPNNNSRLPVATTLESLPEEDVYRYQLQ